MPASRAPASVQPSGLLRSFGRQPGPDGVLEREMPAAAAPALVPERKRPAELVRDAGVLVRGHVALGVHDARR